MCELRVPAQSTLCTTPSHCVQLLDCIVGPTIPELPPAENKGIFTVPSVTRVPELMMTCLDACGKSTSEMSKSPFAGFPLSSTLGYLGCLFGGVTQTFVPQGDGCGGFPCSLKVIAAKSLLRDTQLLTEVVDTALDYLLAALVPDVCPLTIPIIRASLSILCLLGHWPRTKKR